MGTINDPFDEVSQFYLGVTDTEGVGATAVEIHVPTALPAGPAVETCDKAHFIQFGEQSTAVVGMAAAELSDDLGEIEADVTFFPVCVYDLASVAVRWSVGESDDVHLLNGDVGGGEADV